MPVKKVNEYEKIQAEERRIEDHQEIKIKLKHIILILVLIYFSYQFFSSYQTTKMNEIQRQ